MPSYQSLQASYDKRSAERNFYKTEYAKLRLEVDDDEGKLVKKAIALMENAQNLIAAGASQMRNAIAGMKQGVLNKSDREKLRKHLNRVSSGRGLSKIQKPTVKVSELA